MPNRRSFFLFLFVSFTIITQQTSLKLLNKECLCDITEQCDAECCCDSTCDSLLISQWRVYKLCLDDSFGIPFCSRLSQTDTNILDLHSGLRTIYSVIKRLFCITSVNFVQPQDWFKKTVRDADLQRQLQLMSDSQKQSVKNYEIQAQTRFPISGLPIKGSNGICRASSQITKNHQQSSSCRVYLSSSNDLTNSLLSISKLQTSLGLALKKYDTKTLSTGTISPSNLATTCSLNDCFNVIRQIKIIINIDDGSILPDSYIVVGPLTVDQAAYVNVNYEYVFVKVQNSQITFPYSSKFGYEFGSELNLLFKDSNENFYKVFSPFNLAFRKPDGTCRTSANDEAANSFVELKFGWNQAISCYGSINLIYQNLRQTFNFVGKSGASSTKLSQYVNVTAPSIAISCSESVQLIIYFINIGVPQHPQYEVSKVQMRAVTSKDGLSTLYVEFVSIQNQFNIFIPPAPTVDAYLPNDFLFPFFVA